MGFLHNLYKIQFVILVALVVLLASLFTNPNTAGTIMPEWTRPLFGIGAVLLIVVITFRYGELFMKSEKKPPVKDVFDYTMKDTSSKVLGRLAELKYGEHKKRDKFEDYYAVKR